MSHLIDFSNPEQWFQNRQKVLRLNVEIARKIFACKVERENSEPMCGCDRPWPHGEGHSEYCAALKDYSGSIKFAWEVVEALQEKGFSMLSEVSDGKKVTFFRAEKSWSATGETTTEAICRAALEVKE